MHRYRSRRRRRCVATTIAIAAALLTCTDADAADADTKRAPQDYGRPPPETSVADDVADVFAWPLRVILSPLWLVSEFVFRQPIGAFVRLSEKYGWLPKIGKTEGSGATKLTIIPSFLVDLGLRPMAGANVRWIYARSKATNVLDLHLGTWGPSYVEARAVDAIDLLKRDQQVFVEGVLVRRRDLPFYGIGPRSRQDDRVRYGSSTIEIDGGYYASRLWRSSFVRASIGGRALAFIADDNNDSDNPSSIAAKAPGFGRGYTSAFQRLELVLDTRTLSSPRTGFVVEAHEQTVLPFDDGPSKDDVKGEGRRSWVHYGGTAAAMLDMTSTARVVSLEVSADLVDPLAQHGTIPFTDLASLGGDELMPGYLRGRLIDRSAVVASLKYIWPIWVYLEGVMHAAVGNVFGEHFDGFDVRTARLSSGIGIRTTGVQRSRFELLFAIGTDPLDEKFNVSSARFVVGTHHGF